MNEALFTSDVIYIAAADSSETDKAIAEFHRRDRRYGGVKL